MPTKVKNKVNADIKAAMRVSLDIQLKNDLNGMKNILSLSSVVEEILDDGSILILMPIYQGYHYPLPRDNMMLMHFSVDSEMYALSVQFQERIERDDFMFAKVRRRGKIKPHQRRDCFRTPCSFPVTVERLWQNERELYPERQPTEGQMINFCDGGMLFATNENIDKGEKITLTFDMGKVETVEGMALRAERIEDGKYLFKVSVHFRNKDIVQKRRFYKYIVDMQLEEIRRWTQDIKPLYIPGKENEDSE